MNIVMWALAGGILGWVGFAYMGYNEDRGVFASSVIGAIGGLIGGKLVAPMFLAVAAVPADFSMAALLFAAAVAAALVYAGNMIQERWGV